MKRYNPKGNENYINSEGKIITFSADDSMHI
jgi:hypothetical protein